jgi:hypothetical protein
MPDIRPKKAPKSLSIEYSLTIPFLQEPSKAESRQPDAISRHKIVSTTTTSTVPLPNKLGVVAKPSLPQVRFSHCDNAQFGQI